MKNKIGFNLVFAIIAFPIGVALSRDTDFQTFTFKKPVLDSLYLIVFIILMILTFKKKKEKENQQ